MRVRFAPSPTGWLHLGRARIALVNWLLTRRHGGTFVLRIDDTDAERSTAAYAQGIEDDLMWLGLDWDETYRQSERLDRYAEARARLEASGRLYPCFESEEELRFKRDARARRGQAPVYDRAMLSLTAAQRAAAEAGGKRPYFRFRLSDGTQSFTDLIGGPRTIKLPSVSDPVLIRENGTPLYTFCSIIDDLADGVTHIVREDHVTTTAIQLDIASALGGNPSRFSFAHVPQLLDEGGEKMSKRLDGLSLRRLRTDGIEPMAIASMLARLGSADEPEPLTLDALAAGFEIGRLSGSSPRLNLAQLQAMNRRVLQQTPFAAVADRLPAGATAAFWELVRGDLDRLVEARHWWAVVAGTIALVEQHDQAALLAEAARLLPADPWADDPWTAWLGALREATGRKGRALSLPLRLALTGEEHGPDMRRLLPMIGRARAVARLRL